MVVFRKSFCFLRVLKPRGLICIIEWNKKSITDTEEKYGFTIDYIAPRRILNRIDISIELTAGDFVNIFIVRYTTMIRTGNMMSSNLTSTMIFKS